MLCAARIGFTADGSQTQCPVVIGTFTSPGNTKELYVNGAAYATSFTAIEAYNAGSLSVSGSKSFGLPSTFEPDWCIQSGSKESTEAIVILEFQADCQVGHNK